MGQRLMSRKHIRWSTHLLSRPGSVLVDTDHGKVRRDALEERELERRRAPLIHLLNDRVTDV